MRRFRGTDLDERPACARERRPNGVLEPFKAYLNVRFTEAQGQVSGTRLFLEIQARGYPGSRQVVRKHLAALRSGTAEPVRVDIPSPRKITSWIMRPRETLTESQAERALQVPLACPDITRACDLALPWSSGVVEGHENRVKTLKRAMYGRDTMTVDANDETCDQQLPLPPKPVLPDIAAARSRGPADVVEAHWQSLRLSWQWRHAVHQIRSPGRPYPGIVPLLEAAAAQPRLRRLYPFTSHFALLFSSSTSYPWSVLGGSIEPLYNGRFEVRRRSPFAVIGEVETAEEAVALVLELLPTGPEPVITASAGEHV
ncbi:DUF6193 family natural product biosynthesis protein [Streptomyces sp. NPDC052101]|uniref:DUF6193 family natural product biosynthesis protein n=1 Tax=Streptomyces sp. NPDC052101 TaxID=3155763 RepID=UPI003446C634